MKIVKTKSIVAKEVTEITNEKLMVFKDRTKLHTKSDIPDYFVYIQEYAWNAFINHGNSVYKDVGHEAQGIFVGHYYKDSFGEFVIATNYEEGIGNSQSAYVEMSEECLANISEKCQNDDTLMLIWVHTHPNFGVFYSGTDYACLKTNFYKPYQIGIVVDIIRKQHKGFKVKAKEVVEFSDYALFNDKKDTLFSPYEIPKIEIVKKNDRRITELEEEIKRNKIDLHYKISEIEKYEAKLKIKEKDIQFLESELQCKTTNNDQLQAEIQSKVSEIEQIKDELQKKTEQIRDLEESFQNKSSEIAQLETKKRRRFQLCFWKMK